MFNLEAAKQHLHISPPHVLRPTSRYLSDAIIEIERLQAVEQGLFAANKQFHEAALAYRNGDSERDKNEHILGLWIVREAAEAAGGK